MRVKLSDGFRICGVALAAARAGENGPMLASFSGSLCANGPAHRRAAQRILDGVVHHVVTASCSSISEPTDLLLWRDEHGDDWIFTNEDVPVAWWCPTGADTTPWNLVPKSTHESLGRGTVLLVYQRLGFGEALVFDLRCNLPAGHEGATDATAAPLMASPLIGEFERLGQAEWSKQPRLREAISSKHDDDAPDRSGRFAVNDAGPAVESETPQQPACAVAVEMAQLSTLWSRSAQDFAERADEMIGSVLRGEHKSDAIALRVAGTPRNFVLWRDSAGEVHLELHDGVAADSRATRRLRCDEPLVATDISEISSVGVHVPAGATHIVVGLRGSWARVLVELRATSATLTDGDMTRLRNEAGKALFRELRHVWFTLTSEDLAILQRRGWFPFRRLPGPAILGVLSWLQHPDPDAWREHDPILLAHARAALPVVRETIEESASVSAGRRAALVEAFNVLEAGFLAAAAQILVLQVEGLLRDWYRRDNPTVTSLDPRAFKEWFGTRLACPDLPDLARGAEFAAYLSGFYFRSFAGPDAELGRHAVAHGEVAYTELDERAAAVGVFLVDQLVWLMDRVVADDGHGDADRGDG